MNFNDGVAWCKDVHKKQIKLSGTYDEFLSCTEALETYKAGMMAIGDEFVDKFQPFINKTYQFLTELVYPDAVTIGGKFSTSNNKWAWTWNTMFIFGNAVVGWTTAPPVTQGDCMGISANATSAVVFPCTDLKRVMCSSISV